MKKALPISMFFVLCMACNSSKEGGNNEAEKTAEIPAQSLSLTDVSGSDTSEYSIPLELAQEFTRRYREAQFSKCKDTNFIKAFTVRSSTLLQAMGFSPKEKPKYDYVSGYIGLDQNSKYKIMIVPVTGADQDKDILGEDVILDGPYTAGKIGGKEPVIIGPHVFDLIMPCPNSCKPKSPLMAN